MRKFSVLTAALALVFVVSCGGPKKKAPAKQEGPPRVSNGENPMRGKITLQLEEKFRWSPKTTGKNFSILDFVRGSDESLFLLGRKNYRIYKISPEGKVVKMFSNKGEGPGEFKFFPKLKAFGDSLWAASARKMVEFDLDGNLIREFHLKRLYRGITPLGGDKFLGSSLSFEEGSEKIRLIIFNAQEEVLRRLWETSKAGFVHMKMGKGTFVFASGPPLLPRMVWAYQPDSGLVYITEADRYEVWVKDLDGKVRLVLSRQYQRSPFTEEEKEKFLEGLRAASPEFKKALRRRLPQRLCAIYRLVPLPHDYLLVLSVKDTDTYGYDVFGPHGKFLYQIEMPKEVEETFKVYPDGTIATVRNEKGQEVYTEYRVKNLPEIFGK